MAVNEALVLDGLALNDGTVFSLEPFDMAPPPELEEWIKGADSNGAVLAREPLLDNVVRELRIRVEPQASMDLALVKVGLLLDKLQECKRNENGLGLTWVPATSTLPTVTARCLSGQITNLPVDWENGWLAFAPTLTVKLTLSPIWRGSESLLAAVTSSDPLIAVEVTGVAGDVPALLRAVVTDAASTSRRYALLGLESRYYPLSSPPALIIDSTSMTAVAGATGTRTGAYSGATNNVITSTLRPQRQVICTLGNLAHVGTFRPQLRVWASTADTVAFRLVYQVGDGPLQALMYKQPVAAGWNHVDLGSITIAPAVLGSQRWTGRIEAYSTDVGGETFAVDKLEMLPAEQAGHARASWAYHPGALVARDEFTGTTAGNGLDTRVAPAGGTWVESGAITGFQFADTPEECLSRVVTSDASPHYAILGSTSYTDIEIGARMRFSTLSANPSQVLIVRWTDANNHLRIIFKSGFYIVATKVVGGVLTNIAASPFSAGIVTRPDTWYQLRCVLFASGRGIAWLEDATSGTVLLAMKFTDSVLETGGTLATGLPGLADHNNGSAVTRLYDDFYVATPGAEPIVCYSGQSIEFRHDDTLRKDAAGTYAGRPPEYVGPSSWLLPCAGGPGRKARVAAIVKRNDVETTTDDYIADSTTLQIYATPGYLVVPR